MTTNTKLAILVGVTLMGGMLLAGHFAAEEDAVLEAEQRAHTVVYVRQPTEAELAMWAGYQREHNAAIADRDRAEMEARSRK
jgi:hypothetical protein